MTSNPRQFDRQLDTGESSYRGNGSSSSDRSFAHLPQETQARIAAFLLGVELLALSHVNSAALQTFSQEHLWKSRLAVDTTIPSSFQTSSKRNYLRECQSFSFPGTSRQSESGRGFVPVCATMRDAFGSWGRPFSFETWFSISSGGDPEAPTSTASGVLLGAQAVRLKNDALPSSPQEEPSSYAQLVFIDVQRNLFCSVINCSTQDSAPVALALEPNRWYHLALVYNSDTEAVYLNGELVSSVRGSLDRKWRSLYAAQVGAGYLGSGSISSERRSGWCNFHGVVDSFRVHRFALSVASIRQLAAGQEEREDAELEEPTFCLKRDFRQIHSRAPQRVRCSRPQERWCQVDRMPTLDAEGSLDTLLDSI